jgi:antitoxin component YwqK of YwqJK toxin-antitoxin module
MECAVTKANFIGFIVAMCMVYASPLLAEEAITVTAVPGNPWCYSSELIFKQGAKEIARQHTDNWGNITPVSGIVPDGLIIGYFPDGKRMMEIPFKHNHAEGIGHSFDEGARAGDALYRGGILNGTQTGYYLNGKIKTQGEWRDGKPVGLQKLFNDQGRLEMTTEIKENIRTETHFYPDGRKKSARTYEDGNLLESSEYDEDGVLRIHATKFATLNECRVSTDKPLYTSGDAVGFSLTCHCEGAEGCFSPELDARGFLRSAWTKHLVIERDGTQYQAVFCPISATAPSNLTSKILYKDGEQIAHVLYTIQEPPNGCGTRWVDKTAYSACSDHFDCSIGVFERGAASLPSGDYTAWLDAGSKPTKISFKIESGK